MMCEYCDLDHMAEKRGQVLVDLGVALKIEEAAEKVEDLLLLCGNKLPFLLRKNVENLLVYLKKGGLLE